MRLLLINDDAKVQKNKLKTKDSLLFLLRRSIYFVITKWKSFFVLIYFMFVGLELMFAACEYMYVAHEHEFADCEHNFYRRKKKYLLRQKNKKNSKKESDFGRLTPSLWNDSIAAWPDSLNHLNRFISSIESIQYFEGLCMWLLILSASSGCDLTYFTPSMSPLENVALIWLDIDLRLALYPSVGRLLSELAWVGNRSQMTKGRSRAHT